MSQTFVVFTSLSKTAYSDYLLWCRNVWKTAQFIHTKQMCATVQLSRTTFLKNVLPENDREIGKSRVSKEA
jgi:hypothetical protein